MVIEEIKITSFGMLTDLKLSFHDSINVIEGQNEAGKSTIAAFIRYMLYGFEVTEKPDTLGERRKRINWHTRTAAGSMTVRVGDKRYLLTRSTVPVETEDHVAYKEDSSIVDLDTGTPAFGKSAAGEVFFGADRTLFNNTAFIGAIGEARIEEDSVTEAIENILFSGNERINLQRASDRIADKKQALLHEGGTGGMIFELKQKRDALQRQYDEAEADNAAFLTTVARSREMNNKVKDTEKRLADLTDLDVCYGNLMLIQTFDKLHELEKESEDKAEAYRAFLESQAANGFTPTEDYLEAIGNARRRINETYRALTDAKARLSEAHNATGINSDIEAEIARSDTRGGEDEILTAAAANRALHRRGTFKTFLAFLAAGAIGGVEYMATGTFAQLSSRVALGIIGAAFLIWGVLSLIRSVRAKKVLAALREEFHADSYEDLCGKLRVIAEARAKRDGMQKELTEATDGLTSATQDYGTAKAVLTDLILKWDGSLPESDLSDYLDGLEDRVRAFLKEKNRLAEEKALTETTVKEIRRTLSDKSEIDIRARVSPLKRKMLCEINHDEIIHGIADCKAAIEEQKKLTAEAETEVARLSVKVCDLNDLAAKIRQVDERIAALETRYAAYTMAGEAVRTVNDNLREEISPRLGEFATKLMEIMTEDKYTSFRVSEEMKMLFTGMDGAERPADFLSGGTQDLTYTALRLALIDMLYPEKPPVIFDESFAHQDDKRAAALMRALASLGKAGYQTFIFTCWTREASLAKQADQKAAVFRLSVE